MLDITNKRLGAIMTALTVPEEYREIHTICMATEIEIGGKKVVGIPDAETLHAGLGVKTSYDHWIKRRVIKNPEFHDGSDYVLCDTDPSVKSDGCSRWGTYSLTLSCAKRIAMAEHNERGAMVRCYYEWLEREFQRLATQAQEQPRMTPADVRAMMTDVVVSVLCNPPAEFRKIVGGLLRSSNPTAIVGKIDDAYLGVIEVSDQIDRVDAKVSDLRDDGLLTFQDILNLHKTAGRRSNGGLGRAFHKSVARFLERHPRYELDRRGSSTSALYTRRLIGLWGRSTPEAAMLWARIKGKNVINPQPIKTADGDKQSDMFGQMPIAH